MTAHSFTPKHGPVIVDAEASGPLGTTNLKLLLDTGATRSLIKLSALLFIGIDPDQPIRRVAMLTGSAIEHAPIVMLTRLGALGQQRVGFSVIAHTLPAGATVDGLLGLDFFRDQVLTIDFQAGQITVS